MNLRHLVPALGILASTSGALFAENVGGLTVGGFVDTIGTLSHTDDGNNTGANVGAPVYKYFTSNVELRIGYKVGEEVTSQVDLEWNNGTGSGRDVYLEQAYVNYAITPAFSLTTGKFTTYAGWVSADADGLYRINGGPITAAYGGELVGVVGNFAPSEDLGVSVFLVNGLDVYADASTNDSTNDHLGFAVDAVYKVQDVGTFNLEGGYDMVSSNESMFALGANTTLKFASYEPLTIGAEVIYNSNSVDNTNTDTTRLGALGMANHTIPGAPFPMSATGMLQFVKDSVEVGSISTDTNTAESALALLTNPTGDSHFGVNAELSYRIFSPNVGDDEKTFVAALEMIAVIP